MNLQGVDNVRFTLDFKKGNLKKDELKEKAKHSFFIEYMKQFEKALDFRADEVDSIDEKGKKIRVLRCSIDMIKVREKREKVKKTGDNPHYVRGESNKLRGEGD